MEVPMEGMRIAPILTLAFALALTICAAVPALADPVTYPFKDGRSFEIYSVDRVESTYSPGEQISLEVSGRSLSTNVPIEPESGFHVQVAIDSADLTHPEGRANGEYDEAARAWLADLHAPDTPGEYRLTVFLYCSRDESLCAETFGRAAQVTETFHFEVR